MQQHNLTVTKTARYYILGELTDSTKEIIFVLHGYGQLGREFIKAFEGLEKNNRVIIAPEGLNKFYLKGFYGKVGTTWMTKEDRENEINDYINYLNKLYNHITENEEYKSIRVTILGFSQGGATACRWFVSPSIKNAELILWGSTLPKDIDYNTFKNKLNGKPLKLILGDEDEFINQKTFKEEKDFILNKDIELEIIKYPGKHNITAGVIKEIKIFA